MKLLSSVLVTCSLLLFVSCLGGRPISKEQPLNNQTYEVEYLFEHDGCKVYRFRDMGNVVYFTNCTGDVSAIATDSTKTVIRNMVRTR